MDAPNNNEERRESVPNRPLSPTFLDSHAHNWNEPPPSDYNQPHFPPDLYNTHIRYTSHHTRPIQPFRRYNYMDAQGEDLGSRQYTLGPDNNWEVNEALTNGYRQSAQSASRLPQFTSVCVPSDTWSLPPAVTTHDAATSATLNDPPPPSPVHHALAQAPEPISPIASGSTVTLEMLPPASPNDSRSSPETPVTPVTPGAELGPSRRARKMSSSKKEWSCKPCNRTFYRKAEYDRHRSTATIHQQRRQFKCQYCGYEFTRADAKVRHEKMCPNNPEGGGSPKEKGKGKERSSSSE